MLTENIYSFIKDNSQTYCTVVWLLPYFIFFNNQRRALFFHPVFKNLICTFCQSPAVFANPPRKDYKVFCSYAYSHISLFLHKLPIQLILNIITQIICSVSMIVYISFILKSIIITIPLSI